MQLSILFILSLFLSVQAFAVSPKGVVDEGRKAVEVYITDDGTKELINLSIELRDWDSDMVEYSVSWIQNSCDEIDLEENGTIKQCYTLSCHFTYSYEIQGQYVDEVDGECY